MSGFLLIDFTSAEKLKFDQQLKLDLAVDHSRELRARDQWVAIEVTPTDVSLRYGSILPDGTMKNKIATRTYDICNGQVHYTTFVHP